MSNAGFDDLFSDEVVNHDDLQPRQQQPPSQPHAPAGQPAPSQPAASLPQVPQVPQVPQQPDEPAPERPDLHSPDSNADLRCVVCNATFSTPSNRRRHCDEQHAASRVDCPICGRPKQKGRLKQHLGRCLGPLTPPEPSHAASLQQGQGPDEAGAAAGELPVQDILGSVISREQTEQLCRPFVRWLGSMPITFLQHHYCRTRLVAGSKQEKAVIGNLRYILATILLVSLQANEEYLSLRYAASLPAMQALFEALDRRRVGPERRHTISLLLIKIVLWMAAEARQSSRNRFDESQVSSFAFLRAQCDSAGRAKKQRERERSMSLAEDSSDILTRTEAALVARETVARLHQFIAQQQQQPSPESRSPGQGEEELQALRPGINDRDAAAFMAYLVTASLIHCAFRTQSYAHLVIGETFVRLPTGRWQVRYTGVEHAKGHLPLVVQLPDALTPLYNFWLQHLRPRLVQRWVARGAQDRHYVFPAPKTLGARDSFARETQSVTMELIGKPIAPHKFRTSVVTIASRAAETTEQDLKALALSMQHSQETQQRYYARLIHEQAGEQANAMVQALYARPGSGAPSPHGRFAHRQAVVGDARDHERQLAEPHERDERRTMQRQAEALDSSSLPDSDSDDELPLRTKYGHLFRADVQAPVLATPVMTAAMQASSVSQTQLRATVPPTLVRQPGPAVSRSSSSALVARWMDSPATGHAPLQPQPQQQRMELEQPSSSVFGRLQLLDDQDRRSPSDMLLDEEWPGEFPATRVKQEDDEMEAHVPAKPLALASRRSVLGKRRASNRHAPQEQHERYAPRGRHDAFASGVTQSHETMIVEDSSASEASGELSSAGKAPRYRVARAPKRWTPAQLQALNLAHAVYGTDWARALEDPQFALVLHGRNANQLKSKWHHVSTIRQLHMPGHVTGEQAEADALPHEPLVSHEQRQERRGTDEHSSAFADPD